MGQLQHFPRVPENLDSIVKPEELVDIVEMTPLTLQDRRNYNVLLGNAWNNILERKKHIISRDELTKYVDSNNQDIAASLRRLMSSIVVIKIRNNKNGKPSKRQIPLLGVNDIEDRGPIEYSFPPELIDIVEKTQIFARLHTKVMFELSSKYSLALYELIQKRKNLKYKTYEVFTIEEVRGFLGVPDGKLNSFGNLNNKAIKPAVEEVSFLTECDVIAEPVKTGRAVTHVKFTWTKKNDLGAQISAVEELERSKVGRKSRMDGKAIGYEQMADFSQKSNSSLDTSKLITPKLSADLIEKGRKIARESGTGWDIYAIEREFYSFVESKGMPANMGGAWIGFVKKKAQNAP